MPKQTKRHGHTLVRTDSSAELQAAQSELTAQPVGTIITIPACNIDGGFKGDDRGLSFEGYRLLPIEALKSELLDQKKKSKNWYRAHCAYMGLSSSNHLKVEQLRTALPTFEPPAATAFLHPSPSAPTEPIPAPGGIPVNVPPSVSQPSNHSVNNSEHVGASHGRSLSSESAVPTNRIKRVIRLIPEPEAVAELPGTCSNTDQPLGSSTSDSSEVLQAQQARKSSMRGCQSSAYNAEQLGGATQPEVVSKVEGIMERLVQTQTPVSTPLTQSDRPSTAPSQTQPRSLIEQQGVDYALKCDDRAKVTGFANFDKFCAITQLTMWYVRASHTKTSEYAIAQAYEDLFPDPKKSPVSESQFQNWISDGYTLLMMMHAYPARETDFPDAIHQLTALHIHQYHLNMLKKYACTGIVLDGRRFGVNLDQDDEYLEWLLLHGCIPYEFSMIPRGAIWSESPAPPAPSPSIFSPSDARRIRTDYNPALPQNKKLPKGLKEDPVSWTAHQRMLASIGERPSTIEEFIEKLQHLHQGGTKIEDQYLWFPAHLADKDTLIYGVSGTEDDLICIRFDNNVVANKDTTLLRLRVFTGLSNQVVDSSKQHPKQKFKSWHIGIWNKHTWNGAKHKEGALIRLCVVYVTQSQPYLDRLAILMAGDGKEEDLYDFPLGEFHDMVEAAIALIIPRLKHYIPQLMAKHEKVYASLGPVYRLGSGPFCMTVLNLQPATKGHRDWSDMVDSICLILALGDFEGGELCLFEPGMVWELPHGSCMAIWSKQDTHFNLDFRGQRYSFVFTSDQCLHRWDLWRNEWDELKPVSMPDLPPDLVVDLTDEEEQEEAV
ncbi:DEAD-box ATP-dependent RNA helicase 42 [Ceratobasidium sp. AG-Ba]|nr:DEAD-box ATP-dependent RNA helicase 42 [Ceratobasidium sp. AG-Ba]